MNSAEARKILGLGPDEDPAPHLAEFEEARKRIEEMVNAAPNPALADRYRIGLHEFEEALAVLKRGDVPKLAAAPEIELPPEKAPAPTARLLPGTGKDSDPSKVVDTVPRRRAFAGFLLVLVLLTAGGGASWWYYKEQESERLLRQARVAFLEREGAFYVENRRWAEAEKSYAEIESLMPGSEVARLGRRSIEAGMGEEQTQFVGYWTGQAIAELEAGRLEPAEAAARKVLEKFPRETEASEILLRIAAARDHQSRDRMVSEARGYLADRKWEEAVRSAKRLLDISSEDPDGKAILADATAAMRKETEDRAKALELAARAAELDKGVFDQQALDLLREAAALDPSNRDVRERLEKMASYTRTLRVPGDFETPAEALAAARDRDRILVSEQRFLGPVVINAAVDLQGAGSGKTFIECEAADGSAITIGPGGKGARVTGFSFQHRAFAPDGTERFSAALVRGGSVTFTDCAFTNASGHGLAVIEGGEAVANRCRFVENGWNGAAAIGKGSKLDLRDSEFVSNFENGIESWDGAFLSASGNRCEGNSRNGIHCDNGAAGVIIENNQLLANREFGLVIGSAADGRVSNNTARSNLLGGFVLRSAAAVKVAGNQLTLNEGPGLVLEKGLSAAGFPGNNVTKNKPRDILENADLSTQETATGQ
jgi:parallel beta-helix repeat protein